jgi:hypothetical protein
VEYGNKKVFSLTTKFLWLKLKRPIIMYDSQARIALGTKNDNLTDYYEKWLKNFDKCEDQIKQACAKLSNLHLYTVNYEMEREEYIKSISSERWFHERVFDIYLWNKGKNKMASTEKCC